jgi:hypothetical protein
VPISLCVTRLPGLAAGLVAALILCLPSAVRAQALPAGWVKSDIGAPAAAGTAAFSSPVFTVSSRGYDVAGTADQFTFVYRAMRGDVTIVAKVASLLNVDPAAKAGVMVRESLDPASANSYVFATAANTFGYRARKSSRVTTSNLGSGSVSVPVWVKLQRKGNALTASRSTDGVSWTVINTVKQPLSQTLLVGLAVVSHTAGASTSATLRDVAINGAVEGAVNTPPAVSLTSPSGGSSFTAPATTTVAATASDPNGSVARVDFYAGATLLGSDTSSPYSVSWSNVPAGTYVLTAKATDNAGASTVSAGVSVTVKANQAPAVSLTSPSNGATFTAPASIALTASASDTDGTIQKVEFYNGTTLLGYSTASPYAFTWSNVAAGSYSVSAVARDNMGATTVSSWRDLTVGSSGSLSRATFAPAIVPDTVSYYLFEVFAAGSDPSAGSPIATQNLGIPVVVNGECSADVRSALTGLAPGSYIATVSAVTGVEGVLRSAPFAFTR